MLWLLLGAIVLFVLVVAMRMFERASVTSIKALFLWIVALGGASLALLLILTGRGGIAIGALSLIGPLLYQQWQAAQGARLGTAKQNGPGQREPGQRGSGPRGPAAPGPMSRQEAYQVLGLKPGASDAVIRDAHRRLMRGAHPDAGGSDWIAARINQARDILLG